jgi:hypothetical protein
MKKEGAKRKRKRKKSMKKKEKKKKIGEPKKTTGRDNG